MAKQVQELAAERTALIDQILLTLQLVVKNSQVRFYDRLISEIFDKLNLDDTGNILNTSKNRKALNTIDAIFEQFVGKDALAVVREVVDSVDQLITFNVRYFAELDKTPLPDFDVKIRQQMSEWLGIDKGKIKANGYIDRLVKDNTVRKQVKDLTLKNVVTRSGMAETKKSLEALVKGNGEALGAIEKNLGGLVYDTISVTDRIIGLEYANGKGYECAIYEGGLIKTSRKFCIERNGKVFHKSEIEQFNPTAAKPPDYNPFIDLGGYRCRHHFNWISNALALRLRPDISQYLKAA